MIQDSSLLRDAERALLLILCIFVSGGVFVICLNARAFIVHLLSYILLFVL